MVVQLHNHTNVRRRATDRAGQVNDHFMARDVQARQHMSLSQARPTASTTLRPHRQDQLPARPTSTPWQSPAPMTVTLPSFKHLAETADRSTLQYTRAPSIGFDYIPVPLIKTESMYVSPPESIASPTPSASISPAIRKATLPSNKAAKRQSPPRMVEKRSKCTKRQGWTLKAEAQDQANNQRLDEIQRAFRDGTQVPLISGAVPADAGKTQIFPRFDHARATRENERVKIQTGSSDGNNRHNLAQTHLRAEKGDSKMKLQRLLVNGIGWRGKKLQTKVNARSSGMLYEEKELLQADTQYNALNTIVMQKLFGPEGMRQLGALLDLFEPDDVQPAEVLRSTLDDDKTYEFKQQAARIEVIAEAGDPLGLKHIHSEEQLNGIVRQRLLPLANPLGKAFLQQAFPKPGEARARM
ncbi:hypothetical protein AUEXF2481DRAFT_6089 [Aureobasidium subglaciale EXF-2481]|uniref:Uncharacterized protein n=1 Tax=Aureobasidium subglaciale (strain EXF-2481) TaxID=1043005 RepID=A0A074Z4X2_AURSE|nr:uncharacterized protein AUEXF2481DRAFT_6089 [Aureobasidium subglaciale EXF-2481]KAI5208372.1 hypothetical protein E4T38_02981 [Aureobasidium subglaciale]KAI5227344.1 hypothetical protein E4T40_02583 [Aureobasidium subglaciale]KAI5230505.1 hypothetical protein E4T41_02980 [Aureobasidium subglaciale]KAI5264919.1 hypothetical protein E4T46_02758 [Aureobasidium subglaciale]KEQ94026.1 hypothetical protein AUEXF2481DRAFT_6089 [Aureobasidium subglaciale EXF-2481]